MSSGKPPVNPASHEYQFVPGVPGVIDPPPPPAVEGPPSEADPPEKAEKPKSKTEATDKVASDVKETR